jgi:hypothetical protein
VGKNSTYETLVVSRYLLGHKKFKGKKKESNVKRRRKRFDKKKEK